MADFSFLGTVYSASAVFGVGIIIADFLGLLGQHHDGSTTDGHGGSDHAEGGHVTDDHGGHISADHADDGHHVADHAGHDSDQSDSSSNHHDASHQKTTHHDESDHVFHPVSDTRGLLVLSSLRHLRSLVYFSLGFGPIGLLALWKGYESTSLAWSVPSGLAAMYIVRRIMRFQTKDIDSSLRPEDIILSKATVIVPLSKGSMGKVRIQIGIGASEQYALPEHDNESFEKDDTVYVASVSDDCVYVESEECFLQSSSQ